MIKSVLSFVAGAAVVLAGMWGFTAWQEAADDEDSASQDEEECSEAKASADKYEKEVERAIEQAELARMGYGSGVNLTDSGWEKILTDRNRIVSPEERLASQMWARVVLAAPDCFAVDDRATAGLIADQL